MGTVNVFKAAIPHLKPQAETRLVATASEAGRADFAARTERDITVLRALTRDCGRAAVEQVVSGPGLVNIHRALHPDGCDAGIDMMADDAPGAIAESATAGACAAQAKSTGMGHRKRRP